LRRKRTLLLFEAPTLADTELVAAVSHSDTVGVVVCLARIYNTSGTYGEKLGWLQKWLAEE
jgi:hypothetical protein